MSKIISIERPDKDGNGCSLNCGVSFVHTHPSRNVKVVVPYEETPNEIVKKSWLEIRQFLLNCINLGEIDQKDFEKLLVKLLINRDKEIVALIEKVAQKSRTNTELYGMGVAETTARNVLVHDIITALTETKHE